MNRKLDWLENRARLTPEQVAVIDVEQQSSYTFAELNQRSIKTANWLYKNGIRKGDRITLLSPNDVSYFELLFACGKLGAMFVPINWRLSLQEISYILNDCSPKLVCYHANFKERMNDPMFMDYQTMQVDEREFSNCNPFVEEKLHEKDPLAIIYTGGTTGKPKGVVLSHQSILANAINTIVSWNLTAEDTTLTYLPLFHTGGLNALSIPILVAGGKVVIANDFDPVRALSFINLYQCTIVLFVPTMYHMIIETEEFHREDFESMKTFLSGGAPCPLEIYDAFHEKGVLFKEGYGLTEAGPNNFYIDPHDAYKKKGSVGRPMLFNSIKLIKADKTEACENEVGEILVSGNHTFEYYWKNDEATREAFQEGWLHTGDLAKKDEDGYYYIVGRKKDMIITGGENVYPLEVEHLIASHPFIDEVAVVGVPEQKWGEIVTACVVIKKNKKLSARELRQYCSQKLANYKVPKRFLFLDELPKTHVGKIDKKQIKTLALAQEV